MVSITIEDLEQSKINLFNRGDEIVMDLTELNGDNYLIFSKKDYQEAMLLLGFQQEAQHKAENSIINSKK